MRKTNRKYEVRPLGCDWALDIPLGDTTVVLYFNSRNNAELVKDVLEWEDNHPNEAAPYQPPLTPPNEWVSVEERLPDKPGHYLVCTSVNYWHGGCMDVNQEHKYHDSGTPVGYDGTTMSVLDCYYDITGAWNRVCNKHVTHWMPLPAPPDRRPPEGAV